jgi:hypothetical protein
VWAIYLGKVKVLFFGYEPSSSSCNFFSVSYTAVSFAFFHADFRLQPPFSPQLLLAWQSVSYLPGQGQGFVFRIRALVFKLQLFFRELHCRQLCFLSRWLPVTAPFFAENTCLENRFCTGSGRRTPSLKFCQNSYGFVGPPVDYDEFWTGFEMRILNRIWNDSRVFTVCPYADDHSLFPCSLISFLQLRTLQPKP